MTYKITVEGGNFVEGCFHRGLNKRDAAFFSHLSAKISIKPDFLCLGNAYLLRHWTNSEVLQALLDLIRTYRLDVIVKVIRQCTGNSPFSLIGSNSEVELLGGARGRRAIRLQFHRCLPSSPSHCGLQHEARSRVDVVVQNLLQWSA